MGALARRAGWVALGTAAVSASALGLCRRQAAAVDRASRAIEARGGLLAARRVGWSRLGWPRADRVILGPGVPGYDPWRATTAEDLSALAGLPGLGGLAEVDLRGATVAEADVEALRRRLPGVRVRR